ncbi:hypothetical protein GX50_07026 [[Emmonsia] crescens]|uniref:Uncharacterized protein n=1 Tax=[Emmonsia] crescens TaxID=73230 RepID=A0A2B7ZAF5_9EURO|nr:hypothetical protein GX50_07026 [Emmonsia crescens]
MSGSGESALLRLSTMQNKEAAGTAGCIVFLSSAGAVLLGRLAVTGGRALLRRVDSSGYW